MFCASVAHAEEIAKLLKNVDVRAECVSGHDRVEVRNRILEQYETGDIQVLLACDLLNEGWDNPHTQI
ncbi:MAG: DEAD/DEAH box helicase [Flexilinea sp.]